MIDPIKLSKITKEIVLKDDKRRYYRFRAAPYYGGISTADCVGCNLRCIFCWAWNIVNKPNDVGKFYSPEEVAENLVNIAKKKGFKQLRISGNEPTIGKEHLLKVLEKIPSEYLFILETNGILIGYDEDYAKEVSKFNNLHVRVSFKGSNKEEFSKLTGVKPEFFQYQLKALKNLEKTNVNYHPALIMGENVNSFEKELEKINPNLINALEIESLILYPPIKKRLKKKGFIK